jgi:hypothetical protein
MHEARVRPWEAICGFVVLAVVLSGEVALILDSAHVHTIALPDAAHIVQLIFFGH